MFYRHFYKYTQFYNASCKYQCGFCTIDHGDTYVSCTIALDLLRSVLDECVECPFSRVKHVVLAPIFRPASCLAQKWNALDLLG